MVASFNNLLVENLKTGKVNTIKTLLELGTGPFVLLDHVEHSLNVIQSQAPSVATRSVWFWIHQAPIADAVEFCWENRLEREWAGLKPRARATAVTEALEDATHAALSSGQFAPWMASWERLLNHVMPLDPASLLNREALLNQVKQASLRYGDRASDLLLSLNAEGHLVSADVQKWFREPRYIFDVVDKAFPQLLQALVDVGGSPKGLLEAIVQAESVVEASIREGIGFWSHDEHQGSRQVKCLRVLLSQLSQSYQMSPGLRESIQGLKKSDWDAPSLSELKGLMLTSSLLEVPSRDTAKGPSRKRL